MPSKPLPRMYFTSAGTLAAAIAPKYEMNVRNLGAPSTVNRSPCTASVCACAGAIVRKVRNSRTNQRPSTRDPMVTIASYTQGRAGFDLCRRDRSLRFDADFDDGRRPAAAEALAAVAGVIVGDDVEDV